MPKGETSQPNICPVCQKSLPEGLSVHEDCLRGERGRAEEICKNFFDASKKMGLSAPILSLDGFDDSEETREWIKKEREERDRPHGELEKRMIDDIFMGSNSVARKEILKALLNRDGGSLLLEKIKQLIDLARERGQEKDLLSDPEMKDLLQKCLREQMDWCLKGRTFNDVWPIIIELHNGILPLAMAYGIPLIPTREERSFFRDWAKIVERKGFEERERRVVREVAEMLRIDLKE